MYNPQMYAAQSQMGNPISSYKGGTLWPAIGAALFAMGSGALIILLFNPTKAQDQTPLTILTGILVLLVGLCAWLWYRRTKLRVEVFEQGVVYTTAKGVVPLRWTEITSIFQQITKVRVNLIPVRTIYRYTLVTNQGQKHVFTSGIKGIPKLGQELQQRVTAVLMPIYTAAYNRGEWLQFGKLSLSKMGLSNGKETIGWNEVTGAALSNGYVTIRRQGKRLAWKTLAAQSVPNLVVLLNIIDQIRGVG